MSKKENLDDPASRLLVTLTADSIFEKVFTLQECAVILKNYRIDAAVSILVLLKHLNEHIYLDANITRDVWLNHIGGFINDFFDEIHRPKAIHIAKTNIEGFQPLTNQALLAALELALNVCPKTSGRSFDSIEDRQSLAKVLLSFQSNLFSIELQKRVSQIKSFQDVTELEFAEFVRNFLAQNTCKYNRHALARFYAFCCVTEINIAASNRLKMPYEDWFSNLFGVSPQKYFNLACALLVPAYRLKIEAPNPIDLYFQPEILYQKIRDPEKSLLIKLMKLATKDSSSFSSKTTFDQSLTEFMYSATSFHQSPVLQIHDRSICTSPSLLMNKFIIGLPYLVIELLKVKLNRQTLTDNEVTAVRSPLGYIFESYVVFLLRKWLENWTRTEVISPYSIETANGLDERDVVIIRQDTAFVFEIKSTVATLKLRKTGTYDFLDQMVAKGSKQAREAAEALVSGKAHRPDQTTISGIRRVIPCVITYEKVPLAYLNSKSYESHLESKMHMSLFSEEKGIYPLQFMDIEFLESWETNFDLSPESGSPFGYLERRARESKLRYLEVIEEEIARPARPESPKPFDELIKAAMKYSVDEVALLMSNASEMNHD